MPVFKVESPVRHNGKTYQPGETVELEAKAAAPLLAVAAISETKAPSGKKGGTE